jgi:hypothetical protein
MFRFLRRHRWILIIAMAITCISFISFMGSGPGRSNGGSGPGNFGSISGQKITAQDYRNALGEYKLFYLFHNGTWPDKRGGMTETEMQRDVYIRLLLIKKINELNIQVGDDMMVTAANQMLRTLGRDGQTVPMDTFIKEVLQPEGLTSMDFQHFVRHDLGIQQLLQTVSVTGELVTPQEAAAVYTRQHQEIAAQAVFFSASNYLSAVSPAVVGQFYTNYLAYYRLPERVQVSYVAFNVTNYFAQSKVEWAKTNLEQQVDGFFAQDGMKAFPDAKTPDEAKAKIREALIRQRALNDARAAANEFAQTVFAKEPARAENLAAAAQAKGLTVKTTAPFNSSYGPEDIAVPADFTKAAFSLSLDEPFAGPIMAPDAVYVIALARQLPSEIPPLAQIQGRVMQDCQLQQAIGTAQKTGTNFVHNLAAAMAGGKSFAAASVAAGVTPQTLPPFSASTPELPELAGRADLNQFKRVALTTPVGEVSPFEPTSEGGFVLFVQSQLPVNQSAMTADLPQFTAQLRRARQNEAFNEWLGAEAQKSMQKTPLFNQPPAGTAK